ncbi:nucleoid-associated protein [Flavobacterium cellulosilyticum]|uniref:Nucleoid-associated protein n=1 Tax=Flavobacterium cellulosilyticum TaxID=2541731 RepID=A0A4R5CFV4_9FLAO|nr:nucleoid-associated protein [Flavobacterium cellulosilyticum]TDD98505.1 nucleoid-associated protein [Flavobacterium cellulosilyticum]
MQNITLGEINKFIVHSIGNKNNGDGVRFSDILTDFDKIEEHIKQLLNNSFKFEELYQFFFLPNLELNPVYQFVSSIFKSKESFIEQSQNAGRYLYDKSTHPQIKSGELGIIYFNDCKINNEIVDCIGIFKSENKDTILKINNKENGFELTGEKGINTNKLDKGCLIFNTRKENGFLISVVDNTNKSSEAQYWKDDFLGIKTIKNDFHQTNQFLGIAKQFVTKQLDENFEVSKADKIDYLNRSVDYFKNSETFNKQEFEKQVFGDENLIESFQKFSQTYRQENEVELADNFQISSQAVKKQSRIFKSVLKLDRNFDIYIHGDKNLIEKGIEKDGRKYYKIYYQEEK